MDKAQDKKVLVVEDEPDVQIVLATALKDAGFQVTTASNGHEAYNSMKQDMPDFVTLDLVMPRQSGKVFYKKLRKNSKWCKIPVMVVSAHARDDLGQEDFKEIMSGDDVPAPEAFMEKPVDTVKLVEKVAEMLSVEVQDFMNESTEDARGSLLAKMRNVDLDTLRKVREVLEQEKK